MLTAGQDNQADATHLEVLLVADTPIGCERQVEGRLLSGVQQLTIA
jgi:hypothetical protein